jgi:hypothetical protein
VNKRISSSPRAQGFHSEGLTTEVLKLISYNTRVLILGGHLNCQWLMLGAVANTRTTSTSCLRLPHSSISARRFFRPLYPRPSHCSSSTRLRALESLLFTKLPGLESLHRIRRSPFSSMATTSHQSSSLPLGDSLGSSFGSFDLLQRCQIDQTDVTVSKWQSRDSGLAVVHLDYEGELVDCCHFILI